MIKYQDLYNEVKLALSEKRFAHVERVVKRAIEYAEVYGADIETVKLVAIAHDIAKEISKDEEEKYIREYNITLDKIEKLNESLPHAKIGAYICKYKYGFTEDMVNAVRYHTTGRENMSLLEKIIYLADSTEEEREKMRVYAEAIKENIDEGMVKVTKTTIEMILEKEVPIHLDTIRCYNYYMQNRKN